MNTRFVLIERGCPFCKEMLRAINKINLILELDKRIEVIDAWEYEEFDLNNIPLLKKLEKDGLKEGYPLLFIDGTVIEPAPTPEMLFVLLREFLKEDILINM